MFTQEKTGKSLFSWLHRAAEVYAADLQLPVVFSGGKGILSKVS